ncbi:hypothetical protein K461DRAFT_225105 [Myriangium duriaei CBS 260.36]|uniref:tRNA-splicing endonuclease subunit Sen2 n=1 Tax=Myriangium duriaei CBS 260.36 TaxID=1168546 RepID=A0A9P4J2T5_9PEZI|nr:hypothetical protein K461DRAFT_225105 [Myriangium duriaei CBS 260.36]
MSEAAANPAQASRIDDKDAATSAAGVKAEPQPNKPKRKRPTRPNYAKIHEKPLPLDVFPLPAFVPHNPLSLVRILGALISELFARQSNHSADKYIGYFSYETRSIQVTDPKQARALWEMGFFGKGSLSRSEPSWLDRERARLKAKGGGTSEEVTSKRRHERRLFKLERARIERETIEEQLRKEGKFVDLRPETEQSGHADGVGPDAISAAVPAQESQSKAQEVDDDDDLEEDAPTIDQEHLQLSLHEAFFLTYGLGSWTPNALLSLFATHSIFPPCQPSSLQPDNPFLLTYVVYHHYRSLGWVVRPGSKFACDWLLYNRGPVFSHAEFAVMIVPEYPGEWERRWERKARQKDWWEMHCTNRVQTQVRKTLVLCYVEVPLEVDLVGGEDVTAVLKRYKVRDFVVRRWLANRSRD